MKLDEPTRTRTMDLISHRLDPAEPIPGESRVLLPLVGLFWLGNIAATMAQVYLRQTLDGRPPSLLDLVTWVMPMYTVWLVGAPLVVLVLSRRFVFTLGTWPQALLVHTLGSLVISAAALAADALGVLIRQPTSDFREVYLNLARGWLLWVVFTYWFFLAVVQAVRYALRAGARELRATQLEAAVATAQLSALKSQLHPHFLFNALNSVSALIGEEPRAAQKMIARLGELLRSTLAEDGSGDWTLQREIALLREYTCIEEVRFGARLRFEVACEPGTLSCRIPALLLLPLVENAIVHGISPAIRGGVVSVRAQREGASLHLAVWDDGVGLAPGSQERIGLSNTRQRLQTRFGPDHEFRIEPRSPQGTAVSIVLPWCATPESSHAPAA